MKRLFAICLLTAACTSAFAGGDSSNPSKASELSVQGSGVILLGSMSMLAASGQVVVTSIKAVGEGSVLVLKSAANGAQASIKLSGKAAEGLSVATGTVVSVVAVSTGHVLVFSGKALAFIPNEIGQALLHHSRVGAAGV